MGGGCEGTSWGAESHQRASSINGHPSIRVSEMAPQFGGKCDEVNSLQKCSSRRTLCSNKILWETLTPWSSSRQSMDCSPTACEALASWTLIFLSFLLLAYGPYSHPRLKICAPFCICAELCILTNSPSWHSSRKWLYCWVPWAWTVKIGWALATCGF